MLNHALYNKNNHEWPKPWREVTVKLEGYKGETTSQYHKGIQP